MISVFTLQTYRLRQFAKVISLLLIFAACSSGDPQTVSLTTLPPGDAVRGAALFTESINGAPACITCHQLDDTVLVGPGMSGYNARAGSRVVGMSMEEYTLDSINQPASYIVPGFSNVMYNQFATKLTSQDIADLVAYLHTL
jgi:cytochrome c553